MKRNSKKGLLFGTSALVAAVLGVTVVSQSAASGGLFAYRTRAQAVVDSSIIWSASSSKTGTGNTISYSAQTSGGTTIFLYSYGGSNPTSTKMFCSKYNSTYDYGIYVDEVAGGASSLFRFQYIKSVEIVTLSSSDSGAQFSIFTDATHSGSAVHTETLDGSEQTITLTTEVAGAHYFALKPVNNLWVEIKSVKISYLCDPEGGDPTPDTYSISYLGSSNGIETHTLTEIDTASLVGNAEENSDVSISPSALSGYQLNGAFEYTDEIKDFDYTSGEITFTMPSANVTIVLVVGETGASLSSITLSGYTTNYNVNDSFSFDGTVTAHYSDSTSKAVTATSVSSPNMSTDGTPTVTVSYTEGGVTKTADYVIVVGNPGVYFTGRYNYASRQYSGAEYDEQYISFSPNGKGEWHLTRYNAIDLQDESNYIDYYSVVYFDYAITVNGNNYSATFTLTDYDLYADKANSWSGGSLDRPFKAFTPKGTPTNTTCVMNSAMTSLTVGVYQRGSSMVYDTFTFNLAA